MTKKPFAKEYVEKSLHDIDAHLGAELPIYLIGGCSLSLRNYKSVTFDIDVVLENESMYGTFVKALNQAGFLNKSEISLEHSRLYTRDQLENKDGLHYDLFVKRVAGKLMLSDSIRLRAEPYQPAAFRHLRVFLVSPEDIFLFKGFASEGRERDLEDMDLLMKKDLNWTAIYDECVAQSRLQHAFTPAQWISFFLSRLQEFETKKRVQTPITNKLLKIYDELNKN
jgi:hypothetical protein